VEIAGRKLLVNAHLAVTSPWAALLAVETVLYVILWRRRGRELSHDERTTLQALAVGAVAILLLNDSGVVAAATCLLYPTALLLILPPLESSTSEDATSPLDDVPDTVRAQGVYGDA
jgi:hypothetical protein